MLKTKSTPIPKEHIGTCTTINEIRMLCGAVVSGLSQGKGKDWVNDQLELIELKLRSLKEEF